MKKKTKFSLGMKIVTLLTVITMASVGFAAWVITAPVTESAAAGSVKVDTAIDKGAPIVVTAKICDQAGNEYANDHETYGRFIFGKATFDDYKNHDDYKEAKNYGWLDNGESEFATQNLVVYVKVTVKSNQPAEDTKYAKDLTLTFAPTADGDNDAKAAAITKFNNAIPDSLAKPTITAKNDNSLTAEYDTSQNKAVVTIPNSKIPANKDAAVYTEIFAITINWGANFGGVNPYVFYNSQPHTDVLGKGAETDLNALYNAINGIKYNVTIAEKTA